MLSKWLDYDTEASWEKLANALNTMGKNALAANIRSKFMKAATMMVEASTHDSACKFDNYNIVA